MEVSRDIPLQFYNYCRTFEEDIVDDCGDSGHLVDSSPEMGLYKHPVTDGQTQCHIIPHQSLSVGDDDVFVDNFDTRRDYFVPLVFQIALLPIMPDFKDCSTNVKGSVSFDFSISLSKAM
jgi:hypothetical protein